MNPDERISCPPLSHKKVMHIKFIVLFFFSSLLTSFSKDADVNYDFVKAATRGEIEDVKALLHKGADINGQINGGHSALMLASGNGQEKVVKLLLEKGANVNLQGQLKETALHLAAANGHKNIVELLLKNGADFRVSNTGLTPLMMAVAEGHSQVAEFLLSKGENVNAKQPDGWTVLMHAAVKSDPDTIKLLLTKGADPTATNKDGKTAAEIAEEYKHEEIAKRIKNWSRPSKP